MPFSPGTCYKLGLKVLALDALRGAHVETLQSRLVTFSPTAVVPVCKPGLKALTGRDWRPCPH
jgi:hypothetical protein